MLQFDLSKIRTGGNPLRTLWKYLEPLPGGKRVFSRLVGETAPYTGTIGAQVEVLTDGHSELVLSQRRAVTNHLNSIHAVALMNLGEMCSGVAMMYQLPDDMRGIVTHMDMRYDKKARGVIRAICNAPEIRRDGVAYEQVVEAQLYDQAGDVVAVFSATWVLGPKA